MLELFLLLCCSWHQLQKQSDKLSWWQTYWTHLFLRFQQRLASLPRSTSLCKVHGFYKAQRPSRRQAVSMAIRASNCRWQAEHAGPKMEETYTKNSEIKYAAIACFILLQKRVDMLKNQVLPWYSLYATHLAQVDVTQPPWLCKPSNAVRGKTMITIVSTRA